LIGVKPFGFGDIGGFGNGFAFIFVFFGSWHNDIPCKNFIVRKSSNEFEELFINLMSKSNTESMACHMAKIYFDAMFNTSFCKMFLANLQSICKRNF